MKNPEYLDLFYSNYDEDARLTSMHGQVEYLTTMHYIDKYLRDGMQILEIGAGTGRYSHTLARRGFAVTAVELVQSNIDAFLQNTSAEEKITIRQGNALDLSLFADETFDIVLLLGPIYHLYTVSDKCRALSEALRVLKSGGLLYTAYCIADASIICYAFQGGHVFDLIDKNLLDEKTFITHSTPEEIFDLCRKEDIDAWMANFSVERLHYVATDLYTSYMRAQVDAMDKNTFALYLQYHLSICERRDMVGITHHSLDIVRKGKTDG